MTKLAIFAPDTLTVKDGSSNQLRSLNKNELESIRQGGTFHLHLNGKPILLKCEENFTNVEFESDS